MTIGLLLQPHSGLALVASKRERHDTVQITRADMVLEIRTYLLHSGTRDAFDRLVHSLSVPLLREFDTDVVAYGPCLQDTDSYFLMRAYRDLEHLRLSHDRFYGSAAWRDGPRARIVELILKDVDAVFPLEVSVVNALRAGLASDGPVRGRGLRG